MLIEERRKERDLLGISFIKISKVRCREITRTDQLNLTLLGEDSSLVESGLWSANNGVAGIHQGSVKTLRLLAKLS